MSEILSREILLFGNEAVEKLNKSTVVLFGLGGVGGAVCEALARAGIGRLILVDNDTVAKSNLNRQLIATLQTVGMKKTDAAEMRIRNISEITGVEKHDIFADETNIRELIGGSHCDFVCDAIDCVKSKIEIISVCAELNIPCVSCMGTGNRFSSGGFEIGDISKTSGCPLAKAVRVALRKKGINHATVLSNKEPSDIECKYAEGKRVPATVSYVPNIAGFMLAEHIIKALLGI